MQTQPKAMDRWSDLLGARQRYKETESERERERERVREREKKASGLEGGRKSLKHGMLRDGARDIRGKKKENWSV